MNAPIKTTNMLIAALGGEGGGVLTNWLIEVAETSGWYCQSTSLAGVAQRTGATIYYLEFMPRGADETPPVMSLFPAQGDIDIAVTSEIAEAGRMLSRGFISPDKTTLISSDHRVYGITEKSATTDGTINPKVIKELAARYAQRFVHFDMLELVRRHNTVISAALFGAIAGAGVLPFERQRYEEIIGAGKGAEANLKAFAESYERAASGGVQLFDPAPKREPFVLPTPTTPVGMRLIPRISALPKAAHEYAYRGVVRLLDYQDAEYAALFLDRVEQLASRDDGAGDYLLTADGARYLALWMAFEDIPRVAQLKVRPSREQEIREEVRAAPGQAILVTEFFHPRVEEVAAILPASVGNWLLHSSSARRLLNVFLGPRKLRTDTIAMQLVFRGLAGLRRMRRSTLGFHHENTMIETWWRAVLQCEDRDMARELVECGRMVKGYGATRHRTTTRLMSIVEAVKAGRVTTASAIQRLREAAMEGEDPAPFNSAMTALVSA